MLVGELLRMLVVEYLTVDVVLTRDVVGYRWTVDVECDATSDVPKSQLVNWLSIPSLHTHLFGY